VNLLVGTGIKGSFSQHHQETAGRVTSEQWTETGGDPCHTTLYKFVKRLITVYEDDI
jgi:hypothetical protein